MELTQKMPNTLLIEVINLNLLEITEPVVILTQPGVFHVRKVPEILKEDLMVIRLTYDEAMQLKPRDCKLQFAWTLNGLPDASDPQFISVREFIDEVGYNGNA